MEKDAPQSSPLPPPGDPARPVLESEQLQELKGMPGENGGTLLDELVAILLREVPPDLTRLRDLVEKRASADASQLAHRMSGSAASLGAAALRQRLHQVEHATRQGNWPAADAACVELEPEWQLTRAALLQATTRPPFARILIIEDDPVASAVLQAALKGLGHEFTVATDGERAWERFSADPHRVVISDWMLPGIDGLELCRRIRTRGGDYTYFILLSSQTTSPDNLDQAMSAGVDDFLTKPAKPAELKARLHVADRILHYATQVQQLESFIPICSYCKKVRDDKNYWNQIESYINSRTGSNFSHGVCPDCYTDVLVPQLKAIGVVAPEYGKGRSSEPKAEVE